LIGDPHTAEGYQRLKVMERTTDGFEIANEDLRLRGPATSGVLNSMAADFKLVDLWKDADLLESSKIEAES
jgi:ATP-dependent DNA helicase RecG